MVQEVIYGKVGYEEFYCICFIENIISEIIKPNERNYPEKEWKLIKAKQLNQLP